MNLTELQRKLMGAARAHPPSDRVPYGFDQRMLARLRTALLPDAWAYWARALWRAAAPCVAIVLVLGLWHLLAPSPNPGGNDFSLDFERTVLAAANADQHLVNPLQ